MEVVNVKVKYIRKLGYDNLKEWMDDEKNVYIGRKGIVFIENQRFPKRDSFFANPFKVDKKTNDRETPLRKYREYIEERINSEERELIFSELKKLKDKKLGCWCKGENDDKCHGDVLVEIIEKYGI